MGALPAWDPHSMDTSKRHAAYRLWCPGSMAELLQLDPRWECCGYYVFDTEEVKKVWASWNASGTGRWTGKGLPLT